MIRGYTRWWLNERPRQPFDFWMLHGRSGGFVFYNLAGFSLVFVQRPFGPNSFLVCVHQMSSFKETIAALQESGLAAVPIFSADDTGKSGMVKILTKDGPKWAHVDWRALERFNSLCELRIILELISRFQKAELALQNIGNTKFVPQDLLPNALEIWDDRLDRITIAKKALAEINAPFERETI
jgi:hypothetical protein